MPLEIITDAITGEITSREIDGPSLAEVLTAERSAMRVSSLQAKAALHGAGILDDVEAFMIAADFMTRLAWKEAAEFRRNSALVEAIAGELGLTDAAVDDLFRAAALIEF